MKHILISGYYGFGNTGDEAILSGMIRQIKRKKSWTAILLWFRGNPEENEKIAQCRGHFPGWIFQLLVRKIEKSDLVILGGGGLFPRSS